MKQLFTTVLIVIVSFNAQANNEKTPVKDSTVTVENRLMQVEKQLAELQEQVKQLQASKPVEKAKKVVIDRRGSKQVSFQ